MLGDFIIRSLVLLFGYAYPALECFKTVEKNRVNIEELRFWCQYWIIVAILTVCERIGDTFISWVPMYGELKLAFIIFLWYPKTKGTGYIYEALLRPFVSQHETDIEQKLQEWRARAWDFAIYYWHNCTELGQTSFFQAVQYIMAQPGKLTNTSTKQKRNDYEPSAPPIPVPPPNDMPSLGIRHTSASKTSKWPPRPPPPSGGSTINRAVSESPKSKRGYVQPYGQTEFVLTEETDTDTETDGVSEKLHQMRKRLRRSKPIQN